MIWLRVWNLSNWYVCVCIYLWVWALFACSARLNVKWLASHGFISTQKTNKSLPFNTETIERKNHGNTKTNTSTCTWQFYMQKKEMNCLYEIKRHANEMTNNKHSIKINSIWTMNAHSESTLDAGDFPRLGSFSLSISLSLSATHIIDWHCRMCAYIFINVSILNSFLCRHT